MTYDISKAFLANKVYETNNMTKGAVFTDPNGVRWELTLKSEPTGDGYQGALFKNLSTGKYEFASRGTELKWSEVVNDLLVADMQMGFKVMPDQMVSQRAFFKDAQDQIIRNQGNPATDLTAVGDSLGGSLVNLLGVENPSLQVTAFNAYGVGNLVPTGTYSNITNNVFARDPVSVLPGSYMIGKTYMYNEPNNPSGDMSTSLSSHTTRSFWQNASVLGQAGKAVTIDVPWPGGIQGDPMTGMPWPTANDVTTSGNGYNFPNVAGGGRGFVNPDTVVSASGLGTTRNSASFITDTNANDHMAVIKTGGTLGDLWVAQKNSSTGFANEKDFYKAVLASNPNITDVNHIAAGQSVYLPEKMADGSITYNYAGGTAINSNATTGEYHMVVQNADGGQTVYSRNADADAGYAVHQVTTDKTGNITNEYNGHQATLDSDIKSISADWKTSTQSGQTEWNKDGSYDTTVTNTTTHIDTTTQYQANGDVVGSFKTEHQTNTAASNDVLATKLQTLLDQNTAHDSQVLEAAEIRAVAGAQAINEAWGGGRMLDVSDSHLGDYYWSNEHSSATDAPLAAEGSLHGLGLVDGFDMGNGASVWEPDNSGGTDWTGSYDDGYDSGYYGDTTSWSDPGTSGGYTGGDYVPPDTSYTPYDPGGYDYGGYDYGGYDYGGYDYGGYDYGGYDYGGGDSFWPVVLDMDGDGIELVAKADSRAWFDVKGDGQKHNIGWVGKDDAMLVIDDNKNGLVDQAKELSLALWTADTTDTDLQALKTVFDTNKDGVFNNQDTRFADFKVWQDANGDGNTDAGELKTLAQAGVTSINLTVAKSDLSTGGNHVAGFASYTTTAGAIKVAADVGLGYDTQGWTASQDTSFVRMTESGGLVYGVAQSATLNLNLGSSNLDGVVGSTGNDTLAAGSKGAVMLQGGAGNDSLTGGAGDDWLQGDAGADTLVGGAGDDTLLLDKADLTSGRVDGGDGFDVAIITDDQATTMNLASKNLEAVVGGAGNDNFSTTATTRVILSGGAGNDTLSGGTAGDILFGGTGNDSLAGGAGSDIYVFNRGDGQDEVRDEFSALVTKSRTEYRTEYKTAYKTEYKTEFFTQWSLMPYYYYDDWTGQMGVNYNWTSYTASRSVPYQVAYQAAYQVAYQVSYQVQESVNAGSGDTLRLGSDITFEDIKLTISGADLVVNVYKNGITTSDQITLKSWTNANTQVEFIQTADGKSFAIADILAGTVNNDTLTGSANANMINGGTGADTLRGGAGDDTYVVDNASDVVTENANEGTDTVRASVSYTLGTNIENLTLTGTAITNGTGNTLNNIIKGNSANNTLDGGAGADTMSGGAGDDTYIVDNTGDVVTEHLNEGFDTMQSSVTYTLGANLENLTLTGTAAVYGTGNELNNTLTGNSAANMLTAGAGNDVLIGGGGADTLVGGTGDDVYVVSDAATTITENANEGTDTVRSSVSYALAANVENLTLTSTTAINGTGNALNNTITGNAANNILDGGAGVDTLQGGLGDDTYVVDTITDVIVENLNEGTDNVQSSVSYVLGSNLENLALTGAATINGTGNALNNTIMGNAANNVLVSGFGNDTLIGGAGDDVLDGVSASSVQRIFVAGSAGAYTLRYFGDQALGEVSSTESVVHAAPVGSSIVVTGSSSVDKVYVGAGTTVDARNLLGSQDEVCLTGNLSDYSMSWTSVSGAIVLTRTVGLASGESEMVTMMNGSTSGGRDLLIFADGAVLTQDLKTALTNNTTPVLDTTRKSNLSDAGFAVQSMGADTLMGGTGNDTYTVDDVGDVVTELVNEGTDTVQSYIGNYTLSANVENLQLMGVQNTNGTGNALNNTITGNAANNVLTGGFGNDTLMGGAGDDVLDGVNGQQQRVFVTGAIAAPVLKYFSGQALGEVTSTEPVIHASQMGSNVYVSGGSSVDKVYVGAGTTVDARSLGGSVDEVYLTGSFADYAKSFRGSLVFLTRTAGLDAGQSEVVTVSGGTSSAYDLLTFADGSIKTIDLKTALTNNTTPVLDTTRKNNLSDAGFAVQSMGADTLIGGTGNDTYTVDDAGDVVTENLNEGTDTVQSYIGNYTLTANVENLQLMGVQNINGTGNALNNTITGNSGSNMLVGGAGADTFVFKTSIGSNNADTITDFSRADGDVIALSSAIFAKLMGKSNLTNNYRLGNQAVVGEDDYIVYNASTGQLAYDVSGNGTTTATVFATLANKPQDLTAAQFAVI